jgi:hypothetical protein
MPSEKNEPLELSESVPPEPGAQDTPQWQLWIAYAVALVAAFGASVLNPGIAIFLVVVFTGAFAYALLARLFGWRRISWMAFIDKVLEYEFYR